ncbi:hypothetical protein LWI29_038038 [Acer saccharum]|uniref:Uncharacterized protein n=1 Tax=Acer saccharum TaxID=4024 RepID=A0AA39VF59_ACESA|nr:hypothetical protein LWI29_038038 [Acer saccharum]
MKCTETDVEDQAAKISVEEQMQITTIQTMERDLDSAKSETKQLKEDAEKMTKEKGQICSQILEKQRKRASLESDSSTLTQTLDLMQQERVSLSAKLVEKSTFYAKAVEETSSKLQQHKDWVKFRMTKEMGEHKMVEDKIDEQMTETEGMSGINDHPAMGSVENDARKTLMAKLDSAKAKLDGFAQMKSKLVMENSQAELLAMDVTTLEEEHKALLSDKAGETEYMLSLQDQIEKLKSFNAFNAYVILSGSCYQFEFTKNVAESSGFVMKNA